MKLLGIDYGQKRIGLAFADTTLGMVLPYGIVEKPTLVGKVAECAKIINDDKAEKVIVGFPVSQKNEENKNTEKVKEFVFELQKKVSASIEFFDERFSSQAADARGGTISRDEGSAMIILEGYLEKTKRKK